MCWFTSHNYITKSKQASGKKFNVVKQGRSQIMDCISTSKSSDVGDLLLPFKAMVPNQTLNS